MLDSGPFFWKWTDRPDRVFEWLKVHSGVVYDQHAGLLGNAGTLIHPTRVIPFPTKQSHTLSERLFFSCLVFVTPRMAI